MDTLKRELEELLAALAPPIEFDMELLERLVTEDEIRALAEDCTAHDSCRPIRAPRHRVDGPYFS